MNPYTGRRLAAMSSTEMADELLRIMGALTCSARDGARMPADPLRGLPEAPVWQRKGPTNERSQHAAC